MRIQVAGLKSHPNYQYSNNKNDIALITLIREVDFNFYIQPICLPPVNTRFPVSDEFKCYVTGWGDPSKTNISLMHEIQIPLLSDSYCKV